MNKSKKLFLLIAGVFLLIVLYIAYDISTRTRFPGQKAEEPAETEQLPESDEK